MSVPAEHGEIQREQAGQKFVHPGPPTPALQILIEAYMGFPVALVCCRYANLHYEMVQEEKVCCNLSIDLQSQCT